jgi:hypothetical protein
VSDTVVVVVILIISQLLIPHMARVVVRLWPSMREDSVRVLLAVGWYAVMASLVIGGIGQLEDAWRRGFERGWMEGGGAEEELRRRWDGR